MFSHQAFAEQLGGIPYEMLSDFERTAVSDWGVRRDDVPGYRGSASRTVFIVDREGVVRWRWQRSKEQPLPNANGVLEAAKKIAAGGSAQAVEG